MRIRLFLSILLVSSSELRLLLTDSLLVAELLSVSKLLPLLSDTLTPTTMLKSSSVVTPEEFLATEEIFSEI